MAELGANIGKLGLKFWGIPHLSSQLGSTRFGTSRAQRRCRAPREGCGSELPSPCVSVLTSEAGHCPPALAPWR